MTAAEVIEEARDHHGSFDRARVPERVALRALSRLVRRLAEKVTAQSEDALAVPHEIDQATLLAAVESRAGLALPQHLLLLGNPFTWRSDRPGMIPVELTDYAGAYQGGIERFPAVVLQGGKLFPVNLKDVPCLGDVRSGWEDYQGLKLTLVPLPADLDLPGDTVGLPDVAKDALVLNLAVFMAGRSGAAVVKDLPMLAAMAQDAETAAVNTLAAMESTTHWQIVRRT